MHRSRRVTRQFVSAALVAVCAAWWGGSPSARDFLTGPSQEDPLQIAAKHLLERHDELGLTTRDATDWILKDRYVTEHSGVTHLYMRQTLGGIEVYNGVLSVSVTPEGRLFSLGNRFVKDLASSVNTSVPQVTATRAVELAAGHLGLAPGGPIEIVLTEAGPARAVTIKAEGASIEEIPVHLTYLPVADGVVRLAWDLFLRPDDGHAWQIQVDAVDGRVLRITDLVLRDSYKVYAWPAESPNHVASPRPLPPGDGRDTVTQTAANPTASPFGWHDLNGVMGADTITTSGNNVSAQTDLDMNDAFTPGTDVQPLNITRNFSYPINLAMEPTTYREALVTNLFYWNNVSHDIHYLYGFDEASGNFQLNNYLGGGLGGDAVDADAQDGSGTNNANFLTRQEGLSPRMQMYLWIAPPAVVVNSPAPIAGTYDSLAAAFGQTLDATGVTANVQAADDGTATGEEGCGAFTGFTAGRIALIKRGTCEFGVKVLNAQNAGAVAAIIYNNAGDELVSMGPGASGGSVTIPSLFVAGSTGQAMATALLSGAVNATLRKVKPDRDSDFDNAVILHEYGHGVSTRLTGGPQTVTCLSNPQQGGEGWSDWWALALTARAGDTAVQPRGVGTYLIYEDPPVGGGGIRPYPYSTDMAVDPQTYGDLTEGTLTVPHGVGSVWATTLWEMYWAIVDGVPSLGLTGEGFRQNLYDLTPPLAGNQVALRLVMDGLKLQPCNPSFVDARDAILAADMVGNGGAHQCHIWYAFAKRGVGVNAQDGDGGLDVTEDFFLPSSCTQGPCVVPPAFTGVDRVVSGTDGGCHLYLEWSSATNRCGSEPVTYDVYRSTNAAFTPGPATLIAAGVAGTNYQDETVAAGTSYHYIVRARDQLGNQEHNTVRRHETPAGELTPGSSYADDAGDTSGPLASPATTAGNTWSVRSSGGAAGPAVYATTATGNYLDGSCMSLQSQTIYLGANPTLSFQTKYDIEPGWDGAIVEVATASGGFANWTKLDTITYPGVMAGPLGDPACGNPGLRDGQQVFTGTSGGQYLPFSGSLAAYANQPVRIRFVFTSDGATNDLGWFLDDVVIDDVAEPGTCATIYAAGDLTDALTLDRTPGGDISLAWGASCAGTDDDFEVYEGTIGAWYDHVPKLCSTGGATSVTFAPPPGDVYYLVVPRNAFREGSYGIDSEGVQHPAGAGSCLTQKIALTCP